MGGKVEPWGLYRAYLTRPTPGSGSHKSSTGSHKLNSSPTTVLLALQSSDSILRVDGKYSAQKTLTKDAPERVNSWTIEYNNALFFDLLTLQTLGR